VNSVRRINAPSGFAMRFPVAGYGAPDDASVAQGRAPVASSATISFSYPFSANLLQPVPGVRDHTCIGKIPIDKLEDALSFGWRGSVAGRTRRRHRCRACREPDRQKTGVVALLPRGRCCFSESESAVVGPGAFPHTPPRAGARGYFDGTHRSRAEGGTGLSKQDPNPRGAS